MLSQKDYEEHIVLIEYLHQIQTSVPYLTNFTKFIVAHYFRRKLYYFFAKIQSCLMGWQALSFFSTHKCKCIFHVPIDNIFVLSPFAGHNYQTVLGGQVSSISQVDTFPSLDLLLNLQCF